MKLKGLDEALEILVVNARRYARAAMGALAYCGAFLSHVKAR